MDIQINEAGQINIPVEIQQKLGLTPGTDVEREIVENTLWLRKKSVLSKGDELIRRMRGKASTSLSTNKIMELTRE